MSAQIIRPAAFARGPLAVPNGPDDPDKTPPAAAPRPGAARQRDYSLFDIARQLGLYDRCARTIIRHVRTLIDAADFPAPKGQRIVRDAQRTITILSGSDAVDRRATWHADLVDGWLLDRMAPRDRARLEQQALTRDAQMLDANAHRIFG